jgi:hypothetical protein
MGLHFGGVEDGGTEPRVFRFKVGPMNSRPQLHHHHRLTCGSIRVCGMSLLHQALGANRRVHHRRHTF